MKKLLVMLLSVVMMLSLASCWVFMEPTGYEPECEHTYDNFCDIHCNECGVIDEEIDVQSIEEEEEKRHSVEDDGTCLTEALCSICGEVVIEAKDVHIDEDNNDLCDNEGCEYTSATPIYTLEDFENAFTVGGRYKLMNDLDIGELNTDMLASDQITIDLNLNGYEITTSFWAGFYISRNVILKIYNGTVNNPVDYNSAITNYGKIFIEDCTLVSKNYYTLTIAHGFATVKNSKLIGGVSSDGILHCYDTEIVPVDFDSYSVCAICASYDAYMFFNFDPTELVNIDNCNTGTLTDNGDGTWSLIGPEFAHDNIEPLEYVAPPFYAAVPRFTNMELDFSNLTSYDEETTTLTLSVGDYLTVVLTGEHLSLGHGAIDLVFGTNQKDLYYYEIAAEEFVDGVMYVEIPYDKFLAHFEKNSFHANIIGYVNSTGFIAQYEEFNVVLLDENGEVVKPDEPMFIDMSLNFDNVTSYDADTNTAILNPGDSIIVEYYGYNILSGLSKVFAVVGNSQSGRYNVYGIKESDFDGDEYITVEFDYDTIVKMSETYGYIFNAIGYSNTGKTVDGIIYINIVLTQPE